MPVSEGRTVARCISCKAEGKADGKGTPVVIHHKPECPNGIPPRPENTFPITR